ncbi:MAG TPA: DUF2797 domain-containing protein, partial [Arthrobacter sp.]|nr:DUF2797 domain-containing protein [Arthrobacter sp.]
ELPLDAGTRLGFRVAAAGKRCLGHHKVHGPADRDHVLCPDSAPVVKGSQCERCFVVDDSRLIHDFHRGGRVPPGLRAYLMQPHWLYIATFANGASKVGTAADLRKWKRLAEQGAVAARYVARADDGRVVRNLEDLVTRDAGVPQQIRSAAKAAALTGPAPADELDALNGKLAAEVRGLLAGAGGGGFAVVDEHWTRPGFSDAVCAPAARHAYPHGLSAGSHGFRIDSLSGSVALARLDGADLEFVVNLGQLKARTMELGDHGTGVPAVQEPLF